MISLDPIDVKLIKYYYDLKSNEKPDLWVFMLRLYPHLDTKKSNGHGKPTIEIRREQDRVYKNLQKRVLNLRKNVVEIQTLSFTKRLIRGEKKQCIEIWVGGKWHGFEISDPDEYVLKVYT